MITFAPLGTRIWCDTPIGRGVILWVEPGNHDNDIVTLGMEDGRVKHFDTAQIKLSPQWTAGINVKKDE